MTNETTPTYDEFFQKVKASFWKSWKSLNEAEVDRYLASEEGTRVIKQRYEDYLERYQAGEITRELFLRGCVASVGYCLSLMY